MARRYRVAVLASLVVCACPAVLVTSFGNASGAASQSRRSHHGPWTYLHLSQWPRPGISRKLRAHFELFRAARTTGASVTAVPEPAGILKRWEAVYQLNFSQTQVVTNGVAQLWIIPGAAGACVVTNPAGGPIVYYDCNFTRGIMSNGLVMDGLDPDGTDDTVSGLVPNGNASIDITSTTGAVQRAPVVDNVVTATVPADTSTTLAFRNANGGAVSLSYHGK